jgi:hypothetical protein
MASASMLNCHLRQIPMESVLEGSPSRITERILAPKPRDFVPDIGRFQYGLLW